AASAFTLFSALGSWALDSHWIDTIWEDGEWASIRESGNLAIGSVLSSARETPEGASMSLPCLRRLAAACRLVLIILPLVLMAPRILSAATITGRVADPDGRPVTGVRVIIADAIGIAASRTTDGN